MLLVASILDSASLMGDRVLLIGCGEIGSRHLQAIAALPSISKIEVVDPRPEARELGRKRLGEIPDFRTSTDIRWLASLDESTDEGALCIVATRARGRCDLVQEVAREHGYRRFLLEKLVAQSPSEYQSLITFAGDVQLKVWVNCKTRAVPFHKRAQQLFDPNDSIQFSVFAGNHGLATNGTHSVDLFVFYDHASRLTASGTFLDEVLHPSKRGPDIFDLSGTIHAQSDHGSQLTIAFRPDHFAPPCYMVASSKYRFTLDQWARIAFESSPETNWEWNRVPFNDNLEISHMSKQFVTDVLRNDRCDLPMLEDCYLAHSFVLGELHPLFTRLFPEAVDQCPVT